MDRLRSSLRNSFRRKKEHVPESSKPHQWQADEAAVRSGTCSFHVKYLGCVEVFESRGMQVCEEALKVLRNSRRRPVKAILYVSGDGLRVVEDETKGLIVDQTIEKVSFCAPDRNHEKGFSYICRDGTTRRWMCHGFLALKESGERLSHAVGCAFAACLERKQKRDKECGVTMTFDPKNATFTRTGSFRQASITERLQDPQEYKPSDRSIPMSHGALGDDPCGGPEQPPLKNVNNPYAIERPHATPSMLQRQGSFRGFQQLNQTSPFKRQLSLRVNDLPSNLERHRSLSLESSSDPRAPSKPPASPQPPPRTQRNRLHSLPNAVNMSPIPEASPVNDKADPVSVLCQQVSQGLSFLCSNDDPFLSQTSTQTTASTLEQVKPAAPTPPPYYAASPVPAVNQQVSITSVEHVKYTPQWIGGTLPSVAATSTTQVAISTTSNTFAIASTTSSTFGVVNPSVVAGSGMWGRVPVSSTPSAVSASSEVIATPIVATNPLPHPEQWLGSITSATANGQPGMVTPPRRPPQMTHLRSHSLGSAESFHSNRAQIGNTHISWGSSNGQSARPNDPSEAEWAAIATRNQGNTNPFIQKTVKAFEVHM